jgi:hypothetical protein
MMKSAAFVCGSVVLALAASGCSGGGESTAAGTSSGSSGGDGGGGWPTITYPECKANNTVLTGTLDGMPFDKTIPQTGGGSSREDQLKTAEVDFSPDGAIHFFFIDDGGLYGRNTATGFLRLPGETEDRQLLYGSTILFDKQGPFKMKLVLDKKGELVGCSTLP